MLEDAERRQCREDSCLIAGAEISAPSRPVQRHGRDYSRYNVGLMFWFSRNRFVGSYLFFSATSRPKLSP
jgi:hypothetical protein